VGGFEKPRVPEIGLAIGRYLWHKTAVPVWLERFVLAVFATAFGGIVILNTMKLDATQRWMIGIAIASTAYLVAHTLHKEKQPEVKVPMSQRVAVSVVQIVFVRPADAPRPDVPLVADRPFVLDVTFHSRGSAANNVAISAELAIASAATEDEDQEQLWEMVRQLAGKAGYGENSVQPERDAIIAVQYPPPYRTLPPITQDDIEQIKAGTKKIIFAALVRYKDDYGSLEMQNCQSYGGTSWRNWTDCFGHNQIVPVNN
jgi:hypothetical protein